MNVLSLFSGIGGIDLGLQRAGMTIVGQVEIDGFCRRVLIKHWPGVPQHDDVRTCTAWWRSVPRPRVDLVAAGFPCQPASTAGRRRGDGDERWMWPETWAVIDALRPEWVLLENVPGILTVRLPGRRRVGEHPDGPVGAGAVLASLAAGGYDAQWDLVSAAAVGAPHLRDRWWCVARQSDSDGVGLRDEPECQPGSGRAAVACPDGTPGPVVADAARLGCDQPGAGEEPAGRGQPSDRGTSACVADAAGQRRGRGRGCDRQTAERGEGNGEPARRGEAVADADGSPRRPEEGHAVGGAGRTATQVGPVEPRGRGRVEFGRPWPAPEPDGWWSPEPRMGRVTPRIPSGVDRNLARQHVIMGYGPTAEARPGEVLPTVRDAVSKKADEWPTGRHGGLPASSILRPQVFGPGATQGGSDSGRTAEASREVPPVELREVWDGLRSTGTPYRLKSGEQRHSQLDDLVRALSHTLALGAWQEDAEATIGLQNLWHACEESGYVPETLSAIPEVWGSATDEGRRRIAVRIAARGFQRVDGHGEYPAEPWERGIPRLAQKVPDRPARLRALGNSVVPQVAEHIGRIVMGYAGGDRAGCETSQVTRMGGTGSVPGRVADATRTGSAWCATPVDGGEKRSHHPAVPKPEGKCSA